MVFNSWSFLLFFPIIVGLYFIIPHRFRWILLLLASYFFYMSWKPAYALLLIATTLIDYTAGILMGKTEERAKRKKYLLLSLAANLGLLFTFKYFNFFNASFQGLFSWLQIPYPIGTWNLLLPVGLSFYTFQSISYSIDVYRGTIKPEKHLGIFALFVTYFPQLVAGPIERAGHMIHQYYEEHRFDADRIASGLKRMAWGFFKKMVIADRLAAFFVDPVFNHPTDYHGFSLILATVAFAYQIYCDFSGYSDIAIGASRVLGIKLMENFDAPYAARSIRDFWRRWHIALSSWFRDYVYIPLGGSRVTGWRYATNILVTFLLSGLWHGANWTFVFWGALHGIYLVLGHLTRSLRERMSEWTRLTRLPRFHHLLQILFTFCLVNLAWIFFRANSFADAHYIITHLFTGLGSQISALAHRPTLVSLLTSNQGQWFVIELVMIFCLEFVTYLQRHKKFSFQLSLRPFWLRLVAYEALLLTILLFGDFSLESSRFIYFQF